MKLVLRASKVCLTFEARIYTIYEKKKSFFELKRRKIYCIIEAWARA